MAYNSNIPLATDLQSVSQGQILNNFQALASFGNGYADFPVQTVAPSFSAGNDGLFTLSNATTSLNELYVHKQTSAGTSNIPITASILSQSVPVQGANGWTMLPSGILTYWFSTSGNGLTAITLPLGFITFTTIYSVQVTPSSILTTDPDIAVNLVSIDSTTQITLFFSARSTTGAKAGNAQVLIIGR